MTYDVVFRLGKMKAENVSDFTVKLRGFCFFSISFRQNLFQICFLHGKIINVIQSFSFQLYEIIIDYLLAKLTSKQCSDAILISLFFRVKLFIVVHSVERKIS